MSILGILEDFEKQLPLYLTLLKWIISKVSNIPHYLYRFHYIYIRLLPNPVTLRAAVPAYCLLMVSPLLAHMTW